MNYDPVEAIILGALYASALIFVGCVVVMAWTVISCRLPSGCPSPKRTASGYKLPADDDEYLRTLTDENYR